MLDEYGRHFFTSTDYEALDEKCRQEYLADRYLSRDETHWLRRQKRLKEIALLQVCAQIRNEFAPLYLQIPPHLHLDRAGAYLEAFYSLRYPFRTAIKALKCSISINTHEDPSISPTKLTSSLSSCTSMPCPILTSVSFRKVRIYLWPCHH